MTAMNSINVKRGLIVNWLKIDILPRTGFLAVVITREITPFVGNVLRLPEACWEVCSGASWGALIKLSEESQTCQQLNVSDSCHIFSQVFLLWLKIIQNKFNNLGMKEFAWKMWGSENPKIMAEPLHYDQCKLDTYGSVSFTVNEENI